MYIYIYLEGWKRENPKAHEKDGGKCVREKVTKKTERRK
jgi:hypothetical protein